MPMLSGTVRAMLMLWVTIRIVASIWALMSISSWLQVGGTHRVRPGRLVAEDDLRVEHQRAGRQAGILRIPPEISPGTCSRHRRGRPVRASHHDWTDLALLLLRVLTKRERGVVEQAHRAEQGTVLEHDAEQGCGSRGKLLGEHSMMLVPSTMILPRSGRSRPMSDEEDRLTGTGRTQQHADLAGRDVQRHVLPDSLGSKRLGQPLNLDTTNTHARSPPTRSPTGFVACGLSHCSARRFAVSGLSPTRNHRCPGRVCSDGSVEKIPGRQRPRGFSRGRELRLTVTVAPAASSLAAVLGGLLGGLSSSGLERRRRGPWPPSGQAGDDLADDLDDADLLVTGGLGMTSNSDCSSPARQRHCRQRRHPGGRDGDRGGGGDLETSSEHEVRRAPAGHLLASTVRRAGPSNGWFPFDVCVRVRRRILRRTSSAAGRPLAGDLRGGKC